MIDALVEALGPWMDALIALGAASAALAVLGTLLVPWAVATMPADAPVRPPSRSPGLRAVRAVLGAGLVVAGVLMLVLPGQGLLTIALGLWLLDVPAVRRLTDAALRWPPMRRAVDTLRARAGSPPVDWGDARR